MKQPLSAIAEIQNGYQFRGRINPIEVPPASEHLVGLPPGVVHVIQIKDFDDDRRLQSSNLVAAKIDADPEKYEVHEGDVLFLARGHRLFAAAINEPLRGAVATGYFFILRPKAAAIRPEYLAWYINQAPFQNVLRTFMKGTHQPLVSRIDIQDLEIQIPPLSTQSAIVALDNLRVQEMRLMAELRDKRSQFIQALSMKAAWRTS